MWIYYLGPLQSAELVRPNGWGARMGGHAQSGLLMVTRVVIQSGGLMVTRLVSVGKERPLIHTLGDLMIVFMWLCEVDAIVLLLVTGV